MTIAELVERLVSDGCIEEDNLEVILESDSLLVAGEIPPVKEGEDE